METNPTVWRKLKNDEFIIGKISVKNFQFY